jgi:hypothetical protein
MQLPESPSLRPTPSIGGIPAAGAVIADDAETGGNTAAQQLKGQLQAELAEWRALHHKLEPAQVWLEGRIAFSQEEQKASLEARKLELDGKTKEAVRRIAQANADIAALADPELRRIHLSHDPGPCAPVSQRWHIGHFPPMKRRG